MKFGKYWKEREFIEGDLVYVKLKFGQYRRLEEVGYTK